MPIYGHVTQGYEVSPRDMGCHPRLLTYKEELRIVLKLNWGVMVELASISIKIECWFITPLRAKEKKYLLSNPRGQMLDYYSIYIAEPISS